MAIWRFRDRADAGRLLAEALRAYAARDDVLVLALPRGGVPVGAAVARALRAPLDVLAVRKLRAPGQPELALGAIASGGAEYLNARLIHEVGVDAADLDALRRRERAELERAEQLQRGVRPASDVRGKTVIVVDDGVATGATMQAAVMALRVREPARVVVAVPVVPADALRRLQPAADEIVNVVSSVGFSAVGQFYRDFDQVTDVDVRRLLDAARADTHA